MVFVGASMTTYPGQKLDSYRSYESPIWILSKNKNKLRYVGNLNFQKTKPKNYIFSSKIFSQTTNNFSRRLTIYFIPQKKKKEENIQTISSPWNLPLHYPPPPTRFLSFRLVLHAQHSLFTYPLNTHLHLDHEISAIGPTPVTYQLVQPPQHAKERATVSLSAR